MTDQDYQTFDETAPGGPSAKWTCCRVPPGTMSLYDETIPTLYMINLAYEFTNIIKEADAGKLQLDVPEDFPIKDLKRFTKDSIDFTGYGGLSFYDMDVLVKRNKDLLLKVFAKQREKLENLVRRIRADLGNCVLDGEKIDGHNGMKKVFLTHHRSIQRRVACVYTITKDTINKRIIVSFRGSKGFFISTRDWQTNLNCLPTKLETPKKIKEKMEGPLQKHLLVHKGFYNYLFDNNKIRGQQRYDNIISDIREALKDEEGYSIYVTGHSLGGSLATMLSLKLAGAGKSFDDIPRPITCITWAAAMSGTAGYRTAMQHLERDGYIRHLRICVGEDIVPAIPPFSFFKMRLMKHTGIAIRMTAPVCSPDTASGCRIEHSSIANFWTACRNSMFKPIWFLGRYHNRVTHENRLETISEQLKGLKIDDLYKDETVVSKDFMDGNIS